MKRTAKRIYRSERQIARERRILSVVRSELNQHGYEGVTMSTLARKAGVTKKTLYNLYVSKDNLLVAAVAGLLRDIYREFVESAEPGIPAILARRAGMTRVFMEMPTYVNVMVMATSQAEPDSALIKVQMSDSISFNIQHLRHARDKGELMANTDVREVALQILSHDWGMALLFVKRRVDPGHFEKMAKVGLIRILLSVTQGACREVLAKRLTPTKCDAANSARYETRSKS